MKWLFCLLGFHQFYDSQLECEYKNGVIILRINALIVEKNIIAKLKKSFSFRIPYLD